MNIPFTKMHGAGNDFALLDGRNALVDDLGALARSMGDRHLGVGFDQLLVVRNGSAHPFKMEIWNADGSRAEMCGNGIRCFAKWLFDEQDISVGVMNVETEAGVRRLNVSGYENGSFYASVGMGVPDFEPSHIPMNADRARTPTTINVEGHEVTVTGVSMGNPHAVSFQSDIDAFPLSEIGPLVEGHPLFPERVNFEIVHVKKENGHLAARVWERGAGLTLACGTGAAASAAVAIQAGKTPPGDVLVDMPGGSLHVTWWGDGNELILRGPAVTVFDSVWQTA